MIHINRGVDRLERIITRRTYTVGIGDSQEPRAGIALGTLKIERIIGAQNQIAHGGPFEEIGLKEVRNANTSKPPLTSEVQLKPCIESYVWYITYKT